MTDSFFCKKNINAAIWTIIIIFLSFVCSLIWNNIYSKPQQVFVTNKRSRKDTIVNIYKIIGESSNFNNIESIEKKGNYSYEKKVNEISQKYNKLINLLDTKGKVDSLESNSYFIAPILRPKFYMPKIVEGYHLGSMSSFARTDYSIVNIKAGEIATIKLELLDIKWIGKTTPLFVSIEKKISNNSVLIVWSEQYEIVVQKNIIKFVVDLEKGDYSLTFGFYLKNEINKKYPTFYKKTCKLMIK